MPNLHERMLPDMRIKPATVRLPGGRVSDMSEGGDPLSLPFTFKAEQSVAQNRQTSFFLYFDFLSKEMIYFGS